MILGLAAWRPERNLVVAVCAGFLTVALLHLLYHATHLEGFGGLEGAEELAALASLVLPPSLAIWAAGSVPSLEG